MASTRLRCRRNSTNGCLVQKGLKRRYDERGKIFFGAHAKLPDEEFDKGANRGLHFRNMFLDEDRFIGSMEVVY